MNVNWDSLFWLPRPPADFALQLKSVVDLESERLGKEIAYLATHDLNAAQHTNLSRRVAHLIGEGRLGKPLEPLKLAVLSNATINLASDMIPASALRHGVAAQILSIEYEQVVAAAMGADTRLSDFAPDLVLLAIDHRGLPLPSLAPGTSNKEYLRAALDYLEMLRDAIRTTLNVPVIFQTIAPPAELLFGSYDRAVDGTWRSLVVELNREIATAAGKAGDFILDVAALAESIGLRRWFDVPQWLAHKLPFALAYAPLYADHIARILGAIRGRSRKCLVLDLDNTVWGGAIGDEGLSGIVLGEGSAEGEAFLSVQRLALQLRERGIVLAVSSKNDFDNAVSPFRRHPEMILREEHIAVFQANWHDKATNLEAIARTLNLGLDALVMLDDNPAERAQLRAALPMVAVPELPDEPADFATVLSSGGYFEAIAFSSEDRDRAESYSSEARRLAVKSQSRDLGEYLAQLDMVATMKPFDEIGRTRIAQLVNKTNQFNLTTRRYTEAEIGSFQNDPDVFTLQARLRDRYGDSGMIAVIIARDSEFGGEPAWDIDSWLMSCRVLGRHMEQALCNELCAAAAKAGARWLVGHYVPTAKNGMVKGHYADLGFQLIGGAEGANTHWCLELSRFAPFALPLRIERSDLHSAIAS